MYSIAFKSQSQDMQFNYFNDAKQFGLDQCWDGRPPENLKILHNSMFISE